jgi:DNA segregation ATPase FtsK/SpoIIIE-like protein
VKKLKDVFKKLAGIFGIEKDETAHSESDYSQNVEVRTELHVRTKSIYPQNTTGPKQFRFPVIPDSINEEKSKARKPSVKETSTAATPSRKKPFQPTEVISPVYGRKHPSLLKKEKVVEHTSSLYGTSQGAKKELINNSVSSIETRNQIVQKEQNNQQVTQSNTIPLIPTIANANYIEEQKMYSHVDNEIYSQKVDRTDQGNSGVSKVKVESTLHNEQPAEVGPAGIIHVEDKIHEPKACHVEASPVEVGTIEVTVLPCNEQPTEVEPAGIIHDEDKIHEPKADHVEASPIEVGTIEVTILPSNEQPAEVEPAGGILVEDKIHEPKACHVEASPIEVGTIEVTILPSNEQPAEVEPAGGILVEDKIHEPKACHVEASPIEVGTIEVTILPYNEHSAKVEPAGGIHVEDKIHEPKADHVEVDAIEVTTLLQNEQLIQKEPEVAHQVEDEMYVTEVEFTEAGHTEEAYIEAIVSPYNQEKLEQVVEKQVEKTDTNEFLPLHQSSYVQQTTTTEIEEFQIAERTTQTMQPMHPIENVAKDNKAPEPTIVEKAISSHDEQLGQRATPSYSYQLPPFSLLRVEPQIQVDDREDTERQMVVLSQTLENFHVKGDVIGATKGPTVTRFEVQPAPGVKVNKFTGLIDDIKLALAAKDIRMEAPIPGRSAIGIEVPNENSIPVFLRSLVESDDFLSHTSPLAIALGRDISGQPIIGDLKTMPHGLIAGSTGSGKSVCINSIIVSLLYKSAPSEVRLILIDPKVVELAPYNHIPHLLTPVVSDAKQATAALKWAVEEMDRRYSMFADCGARDVERYNRQMEKQDEQKLPYIVIIIDELADLMMVAPHDVEEAICRIAQKARACGIHLLVATQRPSVDVITGLIKANIPSRIAFAVSSQADSRTILDMGGAERLLGKGDMLYYPSGLSKPVRVQGNFVSDDEIERVIDHVKSQQPVSYLFEKEDLCQKATSMSERDELFEEALLFTVDQGQASASSLQRRFRVGYNRAARLIDQMEAEGFISGQSGSKPRDILLSREEYEELFG